MVSLVFKDLNAIVIPHKSRDLELELAAVQSRPSAPELCSHGASNMGAPQSTNYNTHGCGFVYLRGSEDTWNSLQTTRSSLELAAVQDQASCKSTATMMRAL